MLIDVNYGPRWRKHFSSFNMGRYATSVLIPMYRTAEEVIIVSGDYSWLGSDEDKNDVVKRTLLNLHRDGKLRLYSYKPPQDIVNRLNAVIKSDFHDLVRSIRHTPHFQVKASFIKHHSFRQFIYLDANKSRQDFLCTINEGDETRKALDFVGEAFRKLGAEGGQPHPIDLAIVRP